MQTGRRKPGHMAPMASLPAAELIGYQLPERKIEMTKTEKKRFIREFIGDIQKDVMAKVEKMPEEWDGIDLRFYIGSKFAWEIEGLTKERMKGKRGRDYRAEVYSRNL